MAKLTTITFTKTQIKAQVWAYIFISVPSTADFNILESCTIYYSVERLLGPWYIEGP